MNKRILLATLLVIVLTIPAIGCTGGQMIGGQDNPPAPIITPIEALKAEVQALNDWRTNADSEIAKRATNDQLNALITRVTTLEGQSSANTYTKAEVDDMLSEMQDIIDELKEQLEDSDNNNNGTSDYGRLVDSDGNLELWIERIDPSSDPFRMSAGLDEVLFDIVIVNNDRNHTHKFDVAIRITPEDDVAVDENNSSTDVYPANFDMLLDRSDWSGTPNEGAIYCENDQDGWIDKGDADNYTIAIELDSSLATYWNFKLFIEETY